MRKLYLIGLTLTLASCTTKYVQTDLYFGRMIPGGDSVKAKDWDIFVRNDISKAFPAGFTVLNAKGKWLSPQTGELISENSEIVILIHKKQKADDTKIDSLRTRYQSRFMQEAVLRVDKKTKVSF